MNFSSTLTVTLSPSTEENSTSVVTTPINTVTSCCLETQLATSTSTQISTEKATMLAPQTIYTTSEHHHFEDYEVQEHYSIPISILLVNFILVTVLMITIGLAVYPFIKRYWENCDYNFNCNRNNRYWIEDTEQIQVLSGASSTSSSFALLQHTNEFAPADNNSNSMSLEHLTDLQICDLETSSLIHHTSDQMT